MALSAATLARELTDTMDAPEAEIPSEIQAWADNVVLAVQTCTVTFAPGSITGTAPGSGGALSSGAGSDGAIISLDPTGAILAAGVVSGAPYPGVTSEISTLSEKIISHIITYGKCEFSSGGITGVCGNTPASPGPLVGAGSGGAITGLDGEVLTQAAYPEMGFPAPVKEKFRSFCTTIVDHISDNAEVALPIVSGTCPAGGGPVIGGTAVGGVIS